MTGPRPKCDAPTRFAFEEEEICLRRRRIYAMESMWYFTGKIPPSQTQFPNTSLAAVPNARVDATARVGAAEYATGNCRWDQ